ncbi:MAG: hypothetical protein KDD64_13050 [Bdellovibrionales bacterium]|nr:hypothetical protein [Bdellovibrionales bacterium]
MEGIAGKKQMVLGSQEFGHIVVGNGPLGSDLAAALEPSILCARTQCFTLPSNIRLTRENLDFKDAVVWIVVKYRDLQDVLQSISRQNLPRGLVVCSNGLGIAHLYASESALRAVPLVRCLLYYGVQTISGQLIRAGERRASIAGLDHETFSEEISQTLQKRGFLVTREKSIALAEWKKIGVNIAVNTLATLVDARNKVILEHPELSARAETLLAELRILAAREGFTIQELSFETLRSSLEHHGENVNSSLQDLRRGKPPEVLQFLQSLLHLATAYGINTPALQLAADDLEKLCKERGVMIHHSRSRTL